MATSTYLFFTLIIASSLCSFGVSRAEPQKDFLSVYYETLCPYCATFIVKNLVRIFNNGLITILNLRLVPWGNASTATFCQHGLDVCKLNSLEACALDVLQDVLEQKYANETTHLSPPLKFVPWLVLNNQSIGNIGNRTMKISLPTFARLTKVLPCRWPANQSTLSPQKSISQLA